MTFYYQNSQPMLKALMMCIRTSTIFGMVSKRGEFWFYLFLHGTFVSLMLTDQIPTSAVKDFKWEAVSAVQFFLTFFLTFFNGHCYARYTKLYRQCMTIVDNVILFAQEVVVTLDHPELERNRVLCVKYALASVYLFFISLTSGNISQVAWRECVRKGLLTEYETDRLKSLPLRSSEYALVLTGWAMQVFDESLEHDYLWAPRNMRIGFAHNRASSYMSNLLRASHEVTSTLAMPIPFPYYHLMNVVLAFDALLLAAVSAFFKTYMTVFPFSVTLLLFMGSREISCSLADPFGPDEEDFPISAFLQLSFDTCICLLEAFRNPDTHDVDYMLRRCKPWNNAQLRREVHGSWLYQKNYDPVSSNPFAWNREMPIQSMSGTDLNPLTYLRTVLTHGGITTKGTMAPSHASLAHVDVEEESDDGEMNPCIECVFSLCVSMALLPGRVKHKLIRKKAPPPKLKEKPTRISLMKDELNVLSEGNHALEEEIEHIRSRVAYLTEKARARNEPNVTAERRFSTEAHTFQDFDDAKELIRLALQPTVPEETRQEETW